MKKIVLWLSVCVALAITYRSTQAPLLTGEIAKTEIEPPTSISLIETQTEKPETAAPVAEDLLGFVRSRATEVNGKPTVIISYITSNYLLLTLNYIRFLLELDIHNYAIICLDAQSANALRAWGVPTYEVDLGFANSETEANGARNRQNTVKRQKKIRKIWSLRLQHLEKFIIDGLDVVFSDVDAIWLQNPFKTGLFSSETADIVGGIGKFPFDVSKFWGGTLCMGVVFFRATFASQVILQDAARQVLIDKDDQVAMNSVLVGWGDRSPAKMFGSRLSFERPRTVTATFRDSKQEKIDKSIKPSVYNQDFSDVADIEDADVDVNSALSLAIVSHNKIPRFCNKVPKSKWEGGVEIAHCHHGDGATKGTHNAWGASQLRVDQLKRYGLWCLPADWDSNPDVEMLVPESNDVAIFEDWLTQVVVTCKRETAPKSNPNLTKN